MEPWEYEVDSLYERKDKVQVPYYGDAGPRLVWMDMGQLTVAIVSLWVEKEEFDYLDDMPASMYALAALCADCIAAFADTGDVPMRVVYAYLSTVSDLMYAARLSAPRPSGGSDARLGFWEYEGGNPYERKDTFELAYSVGGSEPYLVEMDMGNLEAATDRLSLEVEGYICDCPLVAESPSVSLEDVPASTYSRAILCLNCMRIFAFDDGDVPMDLVSALLYCLADLLHVARLRAPRPSGDADGACDCGRCGDGCGE